MTANSLRSFAGGLILAAAICGAVYFLSPVQAVTSEKLSTDEMKSSLASQGYVIHTKEEWDLKLAAVKEAEKMAEKAAEEKKPQEPAGEEKIVYRMMLSVSSGMTSIDVGYALEQGKILPNGREFANTVESRGLANKLRPGIYEIQSGMTMDEVIAIIFK